MFEPSLREGSRLMMSLCGPATVRSIRADAITKEMVVDVKSDTNKLFLLSMRYANSIVIEPECST
jgi:hypothetical protein